MSAVSRALLQLVSLCAFSAICEQILTGGRLLSSVRFLSGILLIGAMAQLVLAIFGSIPIYSGAG